MNSPSTSQPLQVNELSLPGNPEIDFLLFTLSETKKKILVQLSLHPYLGYRKLSKRLGISIGNVRGHLRRSKNKRSLLDLGLAYPTVHGWVLTPKGDECARKLLADKKWLQFVGMLDLLEFML